MRITEHIVGKISAADLDSLAAHRGCMDWQLRPDDQGAFWLRVPAQDEAEFRLLALTGRWSMLADGRLLRPGRRIPEATLPGDGWSPLTEWLTLCPPTRGAPGMPPERLPFGWSLPLRMPERPPRAPCSVPWKTFPPGRIRRWPRACPA